MVNIPDFTALTREKAAADLARRNPTFYNRYAGKDDEFGFKLDSFAFWEQFFRFLNEEYFKCVYHGLENIPSEGRALLVGNHSGLLPLDGGLITMASLNQLEEPRRLRFLATDWFFRLPGVREFCVETGQVRATLENAKKLLEMEEIVGIYPEGLRGVGKTFAERYRMHDWHPGFVQLAIETQTPILPCAAVGGDEIFPNFANAKVFSQMLRMPFFPMTHSFPWLPFPMNFTPLPVRWVFRLHPMIHLDYPPEKAKDRKLCSRIAKEIQYMVQKDLNELLRERKELLSEGK